MIFDHYSEVRWDKRRWPDFGAHEFACNHCGEIYFDPQVFDMAQDVRTMLGASVTINSAHRCVFWNVYVGGAPLSEHKTIALDLAVGNHDRVRLFDNALAAGFSAFGFYQTFLHVGRRPGKRWASGEKARTLWKNSLASEPQLLAAAGLA